jgi:alpha-glucosidase
VIGAQLAMLLLVCLRGNIFLYQGEELGLPQASIAFEDLRDPEAIANWPLTLGRDGARTPMPWASDASYGAFSTKRPWLPIPKEHLALAVDVQERHSTSQLALTRRFLALRNRSRALRVGSLHVVESSASILVIERTAAAERLLCLFNFGSVTRDIAPIPAGQWRAAESVGGAGLWTLPTMSGLIVQRM